MKKAIFALPLVLLAACGTPEGNAGATIATGAAIGAALDDSNRLRGAAGGAAAGALVAAAVDSNNRRMCTYRNATTGETYRAECP